MNADATCPLCKRPLHPGPSVEHHHVTPKSLGGSGTCALHAVCHKMLHKVFCERELFAMGENVHLAAEHPEMAKFLTWIQKKPADFLDTPRTKGRKPYHRAR